jgi:hypothetical protein
MTAIIRSLNHNPSSQPRGQQYSTFEGNRSNYEQATGIETATSYSFNPQNTEFVENHRASNQNCHTNCAQSFFKIANC